MRLGFNYVARLGPAGRAACEAAVDAGAIGSVGEFWRHTGLSRPAMEQLVRCGAFDRVHPGRPRRELLWELAAAESSLPSRRRPRAAALRRHRRARRAVAVTSPPLRRVPPPRPGCSWSCPPRLPISRR